MAKLQDKLMNRIIDGPLTLEEGEKEQVEAIADAEVDGDNIVSKLAGKDVSINGLTSKGIANTGNIANIGDIATTGKITGSEIVENMSGYAFETDNLTDTTITTIYAGAVKNGNKLTLVQYFKINRLSTGIAYGAIGNFTLPSEIIDKLYPTTVGALTTVLADSIVNAFSDPQTAVALKAIVLKGINNKVVFYLYGMSNLIAETDYVIRFEQTFLLSENLAPQNH